MSSWNRSRATLSKRSDVSSQQEDSAFVNETKARSVSSCSGLSRDREEVLFLRGDSDCQRALIVSGPRPSFTYFSCCLCLGVEFVRLP